MLRQLMTQRNYSVGQKLIRNTRGVFERVRMSVMRGAARCVAAQWQRSDHFLDFVVKSVVCNVVLNSPQRMCLYCIC
jgi:hypothetical protein